MFKKFFKPLPPDFAATNVMAEQKKKADSSASHLFGDELALPEVAELDSESAWAAFNAEPESPADEPVPNQQDTFLPTTCFTDTQPMEEVPGLDAGKPAFSSDYMDILNEIEQDQDKRRRNTRAS